MWDVLVYAKADQGRFEHSIVIEEVLRPLFRVREEILGTGSIRDVVVQCKRDVAGYYTRYNKNNSWPRKLLATYWAGTRRYRLSGTSSLDEATDGKEWEVRDMASAQAVAEFLAWSLQETPRDSRLALVLWSHASGFPVGLLRRDVLEAPVLPALLDKTEFEDPGLVGIHGLPVLADGLRRGLAAAQRDRIDVLGFNSCLMACVEVAHELRGLAQYMVGSQELTPFRQWNHQAWTARLALRPRTTPRELAAILVDTYHVSRTPDTTVSAIRMSRVAALTRAIAAFVALSVSLDEAAWKGLVKARKRVRHYASAMVDARYQVFTVDIIQVFLAMAKEVPSLAQAAGRVVEACREAVAENAVGRDRRDASYGSHGLSIFFPASSAEFASTLYRHRYDPKNNGSPSFVADSGWRGFLESFWQRAG